MFCARYRQTVSGAGVNDDAPTVAHFIDSTASAPMVIEALTKRVTDPQKRLAGAEGGIS
jgi:hypothetical protein